MTVLTRTKKKMKMEKKKKEKEKKEKEKKRRTTEIERVTCRPWRRSSLPSAVGCSPH
jgi:hypothetical protein